MAELGGDIWLVRHGETEWSLSGRHTGRSDIGLTASGVEQAKRLKNTLAMTCFGQVLCSPLRRAVETAGLAGFTRPQIEPDLAEMDYGDFEGLTTSQIREHEPDWTIWRGQVPNGETIEQVAKRARAVIALCQEGASSDKPTLLFAHGHLLRILATQWLELTPASGALFALGPASISVLSYEHQRRVILRWNAVS